jgi:hypothetical protein
MPFTTQLRRSDEIPFRGEPRQDYEALLNKVAAATK